MLAYIMRSAVIISVLSLTLPILVGCSQEKNYEITFQELSSDPGRYNGKTITIEGFYFQGFEIQVIAESLEYSGYAEGHLVPKGKMVWVEGEITKEVYDSLYNQNMMGPDERFGKIKVTGRFEYGDKYGHVGGYNYQIVPSKVFLLEWSRPAP